MVQRDAGPTRLASAGQTSAGTWPSQLTHCPDSDIRACISGCEQESQAGAGRPRAQRVVLAVVPCGFVPLPGQELSPSLG